jgi:hypothetical protein
VSYIPNEKKRPAVMSGPQGENTMNTVDLYDPAAICKFCLEHGDDAEKELAEANRQFRFDVEPYDRPGGRGREPTSWFEDRKHILGCMRAVTSGKKLSARQLK